MMMRFFLILLLGCSFNMDATASNDFEEDNRENNSSGLTTSHHQSLDEFLGRFRNIVHSSLWSYFEKNWTIVFNGYQKKLSTQQPVQRLSSEDENKHTKCFFTDMEKTKNAPEVQLIHIQSRLNTPGHVIFFDDDQLNDMRIFSLG